MLNAILIYHHEVVIGFLNNFDTTGPATNFINDLFEYAGFILFEVFEVLTSCKTIDDVEAFMAIVIEVGKSKITFQIFPFFRTRYVADFVTLKLDKKETVNKFV